MLKNKRLTKCELDLYGGPWVKINNCKRKIIDIKCNNIYWEFVNRKSSRPTSERKWLEKHGFQLDKNIWKQVYLLSYRLCSNASLRSFQIKINHRIFPCNEILFNWSIKDIISLTPGLVTFNMQTHCCDWSMADESQLVIGL